MILYNSAIELYMVSGNMEEYHRFLSRCGERGLRGGTGNIPDVKNDFFRHEDKSVVPSWFLLLLPTEREELPAFAGRSQLSIPVLVGVGDKD